MWKPRTSCAALIAVAALVVGACSGEDSPAAAVVDKSTTTAAPMAPGCELVAEVDFAAAGPVDAEAIGRARRSFEENDAEFAAAVAGRVQAAAQASSPIDSRDADALEAHCGDAALPALSGEYSAKLVAACGQLLGAGDSTEDDALVTARADALVAITGLGGSVSAPMAAGASGDGDGAADALMTLIGACYELPGVVAIAPPTTTTTTPTTTTPPTTECQGASGCAFDNGIDFNELRSAIAAESTANGRPVSPNDVDCDSQSPWPPNRTPIGEQISCLLPMDGYWAITLYDVTVLGDGKYRWEIADV